MVAAAEGAEEAEEEVAEGAREDGSVAEDRLRPPLLGAPTLSSSGAPAPRAAQRDLLTAAVNPRHR